MMCFLNITVKFTGVISLALLATAMIAAQKPADKTTIASQLVAAQEKVINTLPTAEDKFHMTTEIAPLAFVADDHIKAGMYAKDLLIQAESMKDDWDYGNAVHTANLVLGRIALAAGDVDEAKRLLLLAGKTPGSPSLDSFGPDMLFAKELLEKGEKAVVIQYFQLCSKFWKMDNGKLDEWKTEVQNDKIPEFGPNLRYVF
jgi:hypothetical protein